MGEQAMAIVSVDMPLSTLLAVLGLGDKAAARVAGVNYKTINRFKSGRARSATARRLFLAITRDPTLIPFLEGIGTANPETARGSTAERLSLAIERDPSLIGFLQAVPTRERESSSEEPEP